MYEMSSKSIETKADCLSTRCVRTLQNNSLIGIHLIDRWIIYPRGVLKIIETEAELNKAEMNNETLIFLRKDTRGKSRKERKERNHEHTRKSS